MLLGWSLLTVEPASATSVLAPDFDSMVNRSELIFSGRMIGQHCEWRQVEGRRIIVTIVSFDVLAAHKGQPGRTIDLQFLGGTIGDVSLDVSEMPKFKQGERAVLFVEGNGVNASPLIGFYHGRFKLEHDSAGREIVKDRNGPVRRLSQIGRTAAPADSDGEPLTHNEFAAKIRESAQRGKK